MTISFNAGQALTADDLMTLATTRYVQGTSQDSVSSVTLADSAIVVTVAGLSEVNLSARYTSLAGGIRWAWRATGTVTVTSRDIVSAGSSTSSTSAASNIADMRFRQNATVDEEQTTAHINTTTAHMIQERVICEGSGTLIFQFAQNTSNASATTLHQNSFATVRQLVEG